MKINQGGVKCKITNKAGQDAIFTINLSSVGRHAIGPWKVAITDGVKTYLITVALAKGEGDE
jgi:hypothetical protein